MATTATWKTPDGPCGVETLVRGVGRDTSKLATALRADVERLTKPTAQRPAPPSRPGSADEMRRARAVKLESTPKEDAVATATKKTPAIEPAEKTSLDYLQQALDDLDSARQQAQQEVRSSIDSAVERIRDARKQLTARAHDEAGDLQARLDRASEEVRLEVGRTAIRAQRTPEALTAMQTEIRDRKRHLTAA